MDQIFRPGPLPMKIWSGPSKGANCWIFWDSPVTWKDAPEWGIQLELLDSGSVFVNIALGALEVEAL